MPWLCLAIRGTLLEHGRVVLRLWMNDHLLELEPLQLSRDDGQVRDAVELGRWPPVVLLFGVCVGYIDLGIETQKAEMPVEVEIVVGHDDELLLPADVTISWLPAQIIVTRMMGHSVTG